MSIKNVILDIDGVLACHRAGSVEQAAFFKNKGAIITAIKTHYLFPGVMEFVRLLYETPEVRVSFFSSGEKERNQEFVDRLRKLALAPDKYAEHKDDIHVLSREDLSIPTKDQKREHRETFDLDIGKQQKDIRPVLREGDLLENAVLIDDNCSYVAYGQAPNFLYVPEVNRDNYGQLQSKEDRYSSEGDRLLRYCVFVSSVPKERIKEDGPFPLSVNPETVIETKEREVKDGKSLLLLKAEDGFWVCFLDKDSGEYRKLPIHHKEIVSELEKLHQKLNTQSDVSCLIKDKELVREITLLVISQNGLAQKKCHSVNRIFYAAGLFFKALDESKSTGLPISQCLFQRQFEWMQETGTYKPHFRKSYGRDELYLFGLEKLREVNPSLEFTTPHNYREHVQHPISEEDRSFLQSAIENEGGGCCIM